jgi:hypothetical protein
VNPERNTKGYAGQPIPNPEARYNCETELPGQSRELTVIVPADPPVLTPPAARALLKLLMNAAGEQTPPATVHSLHQDDDNIERWAA